ncbi:MAG: molybdenum cofactor guanylyltransferase [Gammaproteobacteria bacterium]|nr:molybdenum cofactor guanylyltransferase [Gammaproteobacteria bacterium]
MKTIGVVLAGGLSSRMLSDKSQLVWQGKTLLEHTSQLLLDAGCKGVLISNNNNQNYIADRYKQSGPLAGIDACLNHIQEHHSDTDTMLIMPVDMPLMSVNLLKKLKNDTQPDKAAFYSLGRFPLVLPVCTKLASLLFNALEKNQNGRGVSVKQLLSHFDEQIFTLDDDQKSLFFNCNTPEEWQNIQSEEYSLKSNYK